MYEISSDQCSYSKAISPLIASVLLVAFAVALGVVVSSFLTSTAKSQAQKTFSTSQCAQASLDIVQVQSCKYNPLIDSSTVLYLNFEDDSDGYIEDLSGNNNNGKLYGNTRLLLHFNERENPSSTSNSINPVPGIHVYDLTAWNNSGTFYGGNNGTLYNGSVSCYDDGTLNNLCPKWVDGKYGKALSFDGVNDYVNVADTGSSSLDLTDKLTIEAWIYWKGPYGGPDVQIITNKENSYEWGIGDTRDEGILQWALKTAETWEWHNTEIKIPTNQWVHVAITYNGSHVKAYKDGSLESTIADPDGGAVVVNNEDLKIGARGGDESAAAFFNGIIDEVRIYNRALTEEEIKACYQNRSKCPTNGLVLYLPFDEGTGRSTKDQSMWRDSSQCIHGSCLKFDGTDDYVEIPDSNSLDITDEITLTAWVKPIQGKEQYIISKRNSTGLTYIYRLGFDPGWCNNDWCYEIHLTFQNTTPVEGVTNTWKEIEPGKGCRTNGYGIVCDFYYNISYLNPLNKWLFLAGTYSKYQQKVRLYVNGNLVKEFNAWNFSLHKGDDKLYIGSGITTHYVFNGTIDEVAIYSKALSEEEIKALYQAKRAKFIEFVSSKHGKGINFDGVDDYVKVPKLWYQNYTILGWVKPLTTGIQGRHLIESFASVSKTNGDGYLIQLWEDDRIYFYQAVDDDFYAIMSGYPFLHDGKFHQFGMRFTFDGTTSKLEGILDGKIVTSSSTTGTPNESEVTYTRIGHGAFNGTLDEVIIYNRSLSEQELQRIFTTQVLLYNPSEIELTNLTLIATIKNLWTNQTETIVNQTSLSIKPGEYKPVQIRLPYGEIQEIRATAKNCPVYIRQTKNLPKCG